MLDRFPQPPAPGTTSFHWKSPKLWLAAWGSQQPVRGQPELAARRATVLLWLHPIYSDDVVLGEAFPNFSDGFIFR